ncbi:MAG TPA: hypothetical protein VNO75_01300 [Gemmatimonadaceae bacterium]|nr:hypothetical protein [Gemmatimonadaceae bacterium]
MRPSWMATWADLKQLAWAVALLWGVIALLAVVTRAYFGPSVVAVALGLGGLVAAVFALITAASLLVSGISDLVRWAHECRARRHNGGSNK